MLDLPAPTDDRFNFGNEKQVMEPKPPKRGRPKTEINLEVVEKLGMLQCTDIEVAAWLGVTTRTIELWRAKGEEFDVSLSRGKAKGRISIRRQQIRLLEAGNATMGVWLGKQVLGQRDIVANEISGPDGKPIAIERGATEALMAALDRIVARREPDTEGGAE